MNEPTTLQEWLDGYRQRRRPEYDSDDDFERHMRVLFGASGYVKLRGWKLADLDAALKAVRGQPIPEPDPPEAHEEQSAPPPGPPARPVVAPPMAAPDFDIDGAVCPDCHKTLPPGRKCGRCADCQARHRRRMTRERMRRQRQRDRQVVVT